MKSPQEMWTDYQTNALWPVLSRLVYTLYERVVWDEHGIPRVLWEVTRLGRDATGELLPYSSTWEEFVQEHLGLHKTTASKYKRLWEVYHVKLGYSVEELAIGSVFALGRAVAMVDKLWRVGAEGELGMVLEGLFGSSASGTYFIADEHLRVKIGVAMNVDIRLASMKPGNADRLTLLHVFDGNREHEFHGMFVSDRIRGEWFNFSQRMAQFLLDVGCDKVWCNGSEFGMRVDDTDDNLRSLQLSLEF